MSPSSAHTHAQPHLIPYPPEEPQVVLFDMDGVLFDTMPIHILSWSATARQYDLQAHDDEFYLYEGMKGTQTIQELLHRQGITSPDPSLIDEIYQYKCDQFRAAHMPIEPIPGVHTLIQELSHRGIRIGVVTGSARANAIDRILKHFGDLIRVDDIVTADDVQHGKPHPEPYLTGMHRCGGVPSSTLVVENAPLGIHSAHQAGLYTIAVATGPIPEYILRAEGANLVMPNMRALTIWWRSRYHAPKA